MVLPSTPALAPSTAISISSIPESSGRHRHSSGWPQEGRVRDAEKPTELRDQARGRAEPRKCPACTKQKMSCRAQPRAWQGSGHQDLAHSTHRFARKDKPSEQQQHIHKSPHHPPKRLQAREKQPLYLHPGTSNSHSHPRASPPPLPQHKVHNSNTSSQQDNARLGSYLSTQELQPEDTFTPEILQQHPWATSCPRAWQGGEGRSWSGDWHLLSKC